MLVTILLNEGDPLRLKAVQFIRDVYSAEYAASLISFPSRLIATVDHCDNILCAAGLRSERDGFFSEIYLDAPVEKILSTTSGKTVPRSALFEVSTMASRAPYATAAFIREIVAFGENRNFFQECLLDAALSSLCIWHAFVDDLGWFLKRRLVQPYSSLFSWGNLPELRANLLRLVSLSCHFDSSSGS